MLAEAHADGKFKSKPPRVKWRLQIAWYRPIRTSKGKSRRHRGMGWCDKESRSGCMVKVGLQWFYIYHLIFCDFIGNRKAISLFYKDSF